MVDKPKYQITFTSKAFNELFDYYLLSSKNNADAYRKTEAEHQKICGCYKYSSYDTFKKIRRRHIKNSSKREQCSRK